MEKKHSQTPISYISEADRKRRKREIVIIFLILLTVSLLTFAENRIVHFGADFPVSNTILMFILININLLLLILLIFLVFRNLVKLLYDRRRRVMGAKLRTRLVIAFVALTILPTTILFFFSINFITTSIQFWFNVPVEQALENSLWVGRQFYAHVEENNRFFLERIAYQIEKKNLLAQKNAKALDRYIRVVQRAFNLDAVEVYTTTAERTSVAMLPSLEELSAVTPVSADDLQKGMPDKNVRTMTEDIGAGELLRTIGTVPYGAEREAALGFVVISILIPPDQAEKMESISRGFEQYQQIKLLKRPIQVSYYITLSIVALLVVFCAVWFGFYMAKTISIPIMELADGTRRVADGDLDVHIQTVADDEIGSLVSSFNKMTRDLKSSREQLELSARILKEQNIEIEEKRQYMEIVLKNVSAGVITLDAEGLIRTVNKSAERMLNLKAADVLNRSYREALSGRHLEMAEEIMENLTVSTARDVELPVRLTILGRPRSFLVHLNALKDDTGRHMGVVMVFDDLTELEKAQRMAAWREVARRIAHEVKNPLTPITLSAQRLKRKYAGQIDDQIFEECTRTIIDHVEIIRNLVNEFSFFARFPAANPEPSSLPPLVEQTVALYKEGHDNITFNINVADDIPELQLDRQQIKQALINLIDNGIAAISGKGHIWIDITHDPILKQVRIEIADDGKGISDEDKTRLFEPYFSTKKAGMGLGLTIVNNIVMEHNGMIRVQDNPSGGAKFVIEFPV